MKQLTNPPTVLITAGPTREALDPVRYISNHSSGKMGYALAQAFLERGFSVVLVSGPVNLSLEHPQLQIVRVNSAQEMYAACLRYFAFVDAAVFAAAVADYRPANVASQKIKKEDESFTLQMVKNVDIAYEFGKTKSPKQVSVGFALETNDEQANAFQKLIMKNFDFVVLNSTNDKGATFGHDTNKITIVSSSSFKQTAYPLKSKAAVAHDIVNHTVAAMLKNKAASLVR